MDGVIFTCDGNIARRIVHRQHLVPFRVNPRIAAYGFSNVGISTVQRYCKSA